MKISVVICTYNRCKLLESVLESLAMVINIERQEVIIIDNNSTDDTQNVIKRFIVNHKKIYTKNIIEKNQGISYARNSGIENSSGDIIAYLDDDAFPCENWINEILRAFNKYEDITGMGGKIIGRYEGCKPEWLDKDLEDIFSIMDLGDDEKEYIRLEPYGENFAFSRAALGSTRFLVNLGRNGTSLLSGEESHVVETLRENGKIYYIPGMMVEHFIHKERLTKEWVFKRLYAGGVSDMRNRILHHKGTKKLALRIMLRQVGRYLRWAFYLCTFNKKRSFDLKCKIIRGKGMLAEYAGNDRSLEV